MLYTPLPTAAELAGTGLAIEDYEETVEVWPENLPIVEFFDRFRTQWNTGMFGRTGLRYEAVYPLLDRYFKDSWEQAFDDLQIMERAALEAMHG